MAEDNELEKRAVEELLKETDRARVRAETMGPAGWLKCPLQSTNKRFLLNTLRSTDLQRRSDMSRSRSSNNTRGRIRSSSQDRRHDRSRSPPTDHRSNGGRTERQHSPPRRDGCTSRDKRLERDKDEQRRHRGERDKRHKDERSRDKDRQIQT